MDFMVEGGLAMWATLILFLAAAAMAVLRRKQQGAWRAAAVGAILCVASGLAGFATGLYATVAYIGGVALAERADVLAAGIRESAHNLLWAAILAFGLVVLSLSLNGLGRAGSTVSAVAPR